MLGVLVVLAGMHQGAAAHTPEEKAFYLQSRIVLQLNPADPVAGNAVGVWHLEYRQLAEAREAFGRVLAQHGRVGIPLAGQALVAAAGRALVAEVEGRPEQALAGLPEIGAPGTETVAGEGPYRDFVGFVALVRGRLLVRLGRNAEAARTLAWSLEHGGYPHDVRFWQGRLHEAAGETGQAIARYREAIEADPFWPEPYARLGALLHRQGDDTGARKVLEQVLELHNPSPYPNNDIRVLWRHVMSGGQAGG